MKDCLGREIKIGDLVAAPARTAAILHLKTGKVVGVEGEKILIDWKKNKHPASEEAWGYTTLPNTLVLVRR